jgi:hypothetical protein
MGQVGRWSPAQEGLGALLQGGVTHQCLPILCFSQLSTQG